MGVLESVSSWWSSVNAPAGTGANAMTTDEYATEFPSAASSVPESVSSWWSGFVDSAQGVAQPDEYATEMRVAETPVITPETHIESSVSTGESHFGDIRDESGDYKPISIDTSTPTSQKFGDITAPHVQEIERSDYTKIEDLGDSKTQKLIEQGYSPEQALAMQADAAKEAKNIRAERYYRNEYDKALESNIALSSAYHRDALASGLPQAPNKFEYVGDISKSALYKSAGVSNIPGTNFIPQFGGSLLKDANIITKAERTGEMGMYGGLGKPTSGESILSLAEQQTIGKAAAKTAGWEIDESKMNKYTPELIHGAGFDLKYKEANPKDVTGNLVDVDAYKPIVGFEQSKEFAPKGTGDFGLVPIERFSKSVSPINEKRKVEFVEAPASNWLNRSTGGFAGGDESLGGFYLYKTNKTPGGILFPLRTVKGSAMDTGTFFGVQARMAKKYKSSTKRVSPVIKKQELKILNLESLNKQIMPKKLGSDLFKFNIKASDMVMKSSNAKNSQYGVKINNIAKTVKLDNISIKLPKNQSKVSGNINKIMEHAAKPVKIKLSGK
jgi:hypothetical protein